MMKHSRQKSKSKIHVFKGEYNAKGKKFGIVVSRFNEYLTSQLRDAAVDTLIRHGARASDICLVEVPGAFEIPLALKKLLKDVSLDAAIVLGVIIRGQTKHFDQVALQSARGIHDISMTTEVPVILGVIPAQNVAQAMERVGVKQMNKGREWAECAIEMANLMALPLDRKKRP